MPSTKHPFSRTKAAAISCLCLLATSPSAFGQQPTGTIYTEVPMSSCPDRTVGPVIASAPDRSQAPIVIYARELDAGKTEEGEARGDVELFRGDQHIATERLLFDPVTEVLTVPGPISYEDQQVWIRGKEGRYSFIEESGYFSLIDYGLTGSSANGSAEWAELEAGDTSRYHELSYTTCPGEDPEWLLYARELELRHDEGMAEVRHAKLEFKGIPILYLPWFTFPIDDRRKTGFLYPGMGYDSDNGLEIGIPWYWNIRPNQDMTLEPRWFAERGFMLSGEYRFLTPRTQGELDFDYMPDDRKAETDRYYYQFRHFSTPRQRWRSALILDRVSDNRYFQDFGTSLYQTARQFLRSSATISGVGRYWTFELMADDFQVIDDSITPNNEPYRRLPRLAYWMDQPIGNSGLTFGLNSELVYFDRDLGVTGARLDLLPSIYWDRYHRWGFIKPSLGYRFSAYDLDYHGEPGDESPSRGMAIASLDAGLIFDRITPDGGLQTLEPRIFYLYVPYDEQQDLPLFDSSEFTFGFSQLFNNNRFAGGDRQGDANQLSVALSTKKFSSADGTEVWSLGVGQIFYFEDRKVQLDDAPPQTFDLSPFIAEFMWHFSPRLSTVAGLQWNWDESHLDVGMFGFRYNGERGERLTFEYRYRQDQVDQFDFRIFWPINERWRVLSRLNYSFADDDLLEIQAGVEYESCCWAVRTVLRRYLKDRDGDYRDGIFVELNLKGLGSIGSGSRNLF